MSLARLKDGNAHRRYLYGYLTKLQEDNPDWLVKVLGPEGVEEYVCIWYSRNWSRVMIIPLPEGQEKLAIRALRRWVREAA